MGNAESNVTSGVKKQTDSGSLKIYSLVDVKGGGQLIALMKETNKTRDYSTLDNQIRELVLPFLYNNGEGKMVPIQELVLTRNKDRPKHRQLPQNRDPDAKSTPKSSAINIDSIAKEEDGPQFREVCWDLDQRGSVGETVLHLCFLVSSPLHLDLAKRLVKLFPKLINDIYQSDEYYGENVLHMSIVNEDPVMVKFLLDHGANFNERAIGSFFTPEDQKATRSDSLSHEWVDLCFKTDYKGYVYWGEYPLPFAACLGQEECYRLLLAKGADPDLQDTNGNTVLHILVIQNKLEIFDLVYECGASLDIKNRQGLTPLTLAAKLAMKDIYFHILKLQREIYWELGNITCAAYPLDDIDTIDSNTGEINKLSVLNLVVYGEKIDHLDMLSGLLADLLNAKWNKFVKFRFFRQFATFFVYFIISLSCFVMRPGPVGPKVNKHHINHINHHPYITTKAPVLLGNTSHINPCYLLENNATSNQVRFILESLTAAGGLIYILDAVREAQFLGYHTFTQNMMTVPSRVLFMCSCCIMMIMVPLRFTCSHQGEDISAVFVMLTTAPYFLFFCRGFRLVGPFVVMIYKMILTDLLCFVTIYIVFVLGFAQAYYVIFLSYKADKPSFFDDPIQSILAMFIMSLSEFGDIYEQFHHTHHQNIAKVFFIMYMALVALLLINMLIAMMGKTYQDIAERKNEWMRQWARIVLVVERGVPPHICLEQQRNYSQAMADGRRALVLRLEHNETEKEELRCIAEMRTSNVEQRARRKRRQAERKVKTT
ncbi:transient receptor potential cation channel subfamily V member 5-like [Argiope bruennichi]|uniref:transient receptor potential cation channel subfamily V member 5-like n=1 Tax=Argiope bruennichi TaxID=94029 RepID=UPI0024951D35|nr:transient receptor potential cation channel subfamily V member 5-like [Argiope bruennichi]